MTQSEFPPIIDVISTLSTFSTAHIQKRKMSKLHSVLFGLVGVLVLDVFEVNTCDVKQVHMSMSGAGGGFTLSRSCPSGYVAVACACHGACIRVFQNHVRSCRARRVKGKDATVTLTCVKDAASNYALREPADSCLVGETIVSCHVRGTNVNNFLMERYISVAGVCLSPDCPACSKQVLCKKP